MLSQMEFLRLVRQLYRTSNAADSEFKAPWTHPDMAGKASCRHLDKMLRDMLDCGAITASQLERFYDSI